MALRSQLSVEIQINRLTPVLWTKDALDHADLIDQAVQSRMECRVDRKNLLVTYNVSLNTIAIAGDTLQSRSQTIQFLLDSIKS